MQRRQFRHLAGAGSAIIDRKGIMNKVNKRLMSSLLQLIGRHVFQKFPLCQEVVLLVRLLHSARAQKGQPCFISKVVEYQNPTDAIVEDLLLLREDLWFFIEVAHQKVEAFLIDMHMQFFLELALVKIKTLWCVCILPFVLLDEREHDCFRFAFSLHEGEDVIDVVGYDVSFLGKGILLCFFWGWLLLGRLLLQLHFWLYGF